MLKFFRSQVMIIFISSEKWVQYIRFMVGWKKKLNIFVYWVVDIGNFVLIVILIDGSYNSSQDRHSKDISGEI